VKPSLFDFEEDRLKREVKRLKAERVLIQLPEGLKPEGSRLARIVEDAGAVAIVSADPCYGACDLSVREAKNLRADLLVHFGHSRIIERSEGISVIYIEARAMASRSPAVAEALHLLKLWNRIGLVTTIQHLHTLADIRRQLLKANKTAVIGDASNQLYPGQIIGCDYSNARVLMKDVDAFLFVGGGKFHALGVALATSMPTVVADPYELRAYSVDDEAQKIRRQRWGSIEGAAKAQSLGILIGLKIGQQRFEKAVEIRKKLETAGKRTTLLALHEITPESLMQYPDLDAYVNTACPRISLDDASKFHKPVLTVNESLVVAGELSWAQLLRKGWFQN